MDKPPQILRFTIPRIEKLSSQTWSQQAFEMSQPTDTVAAQPALAHLPFPPEIRDRIYRLVLALEYDPKYQLEDDACMPGPAPNAVSGSASASVQVDLAKDDLAKDDREFLDRIKGPDKRCLSFLLVSKQTYREAYHIFYSQNNLQFLNVNYLLQFLKKIGYARRLHVSHITFVWMGSEAKAAFRMLQQCSRLGSLDIILPCRLGLDETCDFHRLGSNMLREVRGLKAVTFKCPADHEEHLARYLRFYHRQFPQGNVDWEQIERAKHVIRTELLRAYMMRSRSEWFALGADERIDLFNPRKERFGKSETQSLHESQSTCPIRGWVCPRTPTSAFGECRKRWRETRRGMVQQYGLS